jgi:hypothetical protein
MHFGILDSEGNVLAWFDDRGAAESALDRMSGRAGLPGDLALIAFEGDSPVGQSEVRSAATEARFVSFVTAEFEPSALAEIGRELQSMSTARVREVVLN